MPCNSLRLKLRDDAYFLCTTSKRFLVAERSVEYCLLLYITADSLHISPDTAILALSKLINTVDHSDPTPESTRKFRCVVSCDNSSVFLLTIGTNMAAIHTGRIKYRATIIRCDIMISR